MINLRSLMDLLPYYYKDQDTYKVNGKGLLERYLDIFGAYFDDQVLGDINSLSDIIDIDNTPEIYLGYLWEFMGSMPYANPQAIDPEKWKQYFNGFSSDSTINNLKRIWLYRKDSDGDHYTLTTSQVRTLVKYSIALFSIRGTKKFFEVLLKLYGFDTVISNGNTYPVTNIVDDDDSDYYGSDQDYYGTDEDYAGSVDSIFNALSEVTKLDTEWVTLDQDTIDNHINCTKLVSINFKLTPTTYSYRNGTNEFKRLQDRMFKLISIFLPIGTRPHIIWDGILPSSGSTPLAAFAPTVNRSIEVYVNRTPVGWDVTDNVFVASTEYPGWYRVYDRADSHGTPARYFDSVGYLRFMVRVKDTFTNASLMSSEPAFISDQPKKFKVDFMGSGTWSDTEYEDGHIFELKAGSTGAIYPKFKVSVLNEADFDLTSGQLNTFILAGWKKVFNYNLFSWYNSSVSLELTNTHNYIPILIQSASVSTYTNDADPSDDTFNPEPVMLDGSLLTLCTSGTTLDDRAGNPVSYATYDGLCIYAIHLFEEGTYTFYQQNNPNKKVTLKVTRADETLTVSLVEGLANNMIDNDTPECSIRIKATSNQPTLKSLVTLPMYIDDNGGNIWSSICTAAGSNSPANNVGNSLNKPYYHLVSTNLYYLNSSNRALPINFNHAFLNNPVHAESQYIKFVVKEYTDVDHPSDYMITTLIYYPVTGKIYVDRVSYDTSGADSEQTETWTYGDNVKVRDYNIPFRNLFTIVSPTKGRYIDSIGDWLSGDESLSVGNIYISTGLVRIASDNDVSGNTFTVEYSGLYDNEVFIKETSNPQALHWNNGELITLGDPGHYRFYGTNGTLLSSNKVDINVESNKYNEKYYLEVSDGDKADDEEYMIRTKIPVPDNVVADQVCNWSFNFSITLDKSIVEASDILASDPNAFDFEVILYKGSTPNQGQFLNSYTASTLITVDSDGNVLPNYKVEGTITLPWRYGNYNLSQVEGAANYPPGMYCVELHAKNKVWPNSPTYRVVDVYAIPQKFDGNLYFDVDVISKAWTSPAGQMYDIDPLTGKRTWGWYKTNPDYLYSVRLVQYNPAVDTPSFRLKLTNNTVGYTRVYLYKLVENGSEWDQDANAAYPKITSAGHVNNLHWLDEAVPSEWGFPGQMGTNGWEYDPASYTGRWLFTGSVYQLGELIKGPQEPGKYIFLVNQISGIDSKIINYAYLSVKEDLDYSLVVDPMIAIIQGTAVGTTVNAYSNAKFTKEKLFVTASNNQETEILEYHPVPYAFYAYQPGTYRFRLYKYESGSYIPVPSQDDQMYATFKVLTDNGISDEYLYWDWSNTGEKAVQVATTSADVEWSVKVQTE